MAATDDAQGTLRRGGEGTAIHDRAAIEVEVLVSSSSGFEFLKPAEGYRDLLRQIRIRNVSRHPQCGVNNVVIQQIEDGI